MYRKLSFKKSHDLTVDTIIKIQEDLENSRASGQEILIKDPVVRREQFQATKRWNTILTQFYNDMPRKTNRRQLKFYSDSFTGKEATDFLLQLFPKVVPNKPFSLTNAEKFMQLLITKNLVENVRDAKNKTFTSNATLYKFLNDKIRAEIDETKPMPRSSSLTDLKNLSSGSFKEKLLKTKRRSHSFSMSNNPFNTSKTPLVDVQEVSDTTISRSQRPAVKPNPVDQVVEDQDYLMAWKNLLLKMVGVQSICDMMEDHLYGAHIKWNCTEIGERGIVKCPKTSDDLPNEVKKGFKILSEWKRGDELECSPNQVFDTLFKKLCVTIPIIPSYANPKFAVFWKFFHRRAVQNEYENVFYRNDDPGLSFASSSTFTGSSLSSESEGLRFIDEMETPVVSGRTRRNMPSGHQEMTDIKERFFAGLQVLLLSLKPDVRRRLNMICRYVKRCQENINLKLHESKTNR
uniref:DEP domain-containing protein n=1 Tax=Panagrolaimus sp. JU765 TaxID=591449 RepID=A0AC34QA29_9BILA